LYLGNDRLWDLLALPEGEPLLRDWGRLAIALLFDRNQAYPADLHESVIRALLAGDNLTVQALFKYRAEPLFHKLLKRPLKKETLAAALKKLFQEGPASPAVLQKFTHLTDEALTDYVGPPPEGIKTWVPCYYTYYVTWKLWNGLDPTTMEWVQGIADPV